MLTAVYSRRSDEERYESACSDLKQLSAVGFYQFESFPGNNFVNLRNGYQQILDFLIAKIPSQVIRLNERVDNINYSGDRVTVRTNRNTYTSNTVLVTIPLGNLKRNQQQLFTPSLPARKVNGINNLGFGDMNKIFTVFTQPVLSNNLEELNILNKINFDFKLTSSLIKWQLTVF